MRDCHIFHLLRYWVRVRETVKWWHSVWITNTMVWMFQEPTHQRFWTGWNFTWNSLKKIKCSILKYLHKIPWVNLLFTQETVSKVFSSFACNWCGSVLTHCVLMLSETYDQYMEVHSSFPWSLVFYLHLSYTDGREAVLHHLTSLLQLLTINTQFLNVLSLCATRTPQLV